MTENGDMDVLDVLEALREVGSIHLNLALLRESNILPAILHLASHPHPSIALFASNILRLLRQTMAFHVAILLDPEFVRQPLAELAALAAAQQVPIPPELEAVTHVPSCTTPGDAEIGVAPMPLPQSRPATSASAYYSPPRVPLSVHTSSAPSPLPLPPPGLASIDSNIRPMPPPQDVEGSDIVGSRGPCGTDAEEVHFSVAPGRGPTTPMLFKLGGQACQQGESHRTQGMAADGEEGLNLMEHWAV